MLKIWGGGGDLSFVCVNVGFISPHGRMRELCNKLAGEART